MQATGHPGRAAYPPSRQDQRQYPASAALVLDHALPAEHAAGLLAYALANRARFTPAATLAPDLSVQRDGLRKARTLADLGQFHGLAGHILSAHRDAVHARFGPIAIQPGALEEEIAASGDGDFFARHNDSGAAPVAHRRFTLILYLHRQPRPFSGGTLLIYDPDSAAACVPVDAIEPRHNRCVLFPAAAFHEILVVATAPGDFSASRFAVTSWF
jgi:Rps23 Pro-64 3,4-dihydroxylase Tpa1-like proline 4-hydroxylase